MEALELLENWDGYFVEGGSEGWVNATVNSDAWVLQDRWITNMLELVFEDELNTETLGWSNQGKNLLFNVLLRSLPGSSPQLANQINWFEKNPPLGGLGKIKLAEAYLEKGQTDKVGELIKEGWETATISKNDLGYYRAKFKKFIDSDDHIKRADYLAWEKKYWDLKRMLKYLPKDQKALYNARQRLMSNSYVNCMKLKTDIC